MVIFKLITLALLLFMNQMLNALCLSPQRVDCLALRQKIALDVFVKDTARRYRIGSRFKVSQSFDY